MGQNNNLTVPIAIIIAGIFIAGAVYFTNRNAVPAPSASDTNTEDKIDLAPITDQDHILGNPDADIIVVEYSDTECPYCKSFHATMNKVMEEYGKTGQVAWVYRHFPLDSIHPKADKEAEATECAEELGGPDMFWNYVNKIYEITPSNNGLDLGLLPQIAEELGLDRGAFQECLDSGKYADKVEAAFQTGVTAGVRGTPHSIVITTADGAMYRMEGSQPYAAVKQIIEAGLTQTPQAQ